MSSDSVRCVKVEVPATTANLGAGFDVLGLALELSNLIEVEQVDAPGVHVSIEGLPSAAQLPTDASHLVVQAAWRFFEAAGLKRPEGLRVRQTIRVPLAGGLGSSATAIVGGILAASALSGADCSLEELLQLACSIEGHPDNVAPALLGGLVASVQDESGKVCAIPVPVDEAWAPAAVLVIPEFRLNTSDARSILQSTVPFSHAVHNVGRAALFVAAAAAGRMDCLDICMDDRLHQQCRSRLVPGLHQVFAAGKKAGARGVALSGSGPTVLALADPNEAEAVGRSMQQAFLDAGVQAQIVHTRPRYSGAVVEVLRR